MRVIIVDDALLIRLQLKKFFEEEMQFEVVGLGTDGNEAVQLFKKKRPHIIVIDLAMPNKTGYEALREIMTIDENAKVIICSAIKDPTMLTFALNCGARSFIKKPLEFNNPNYMRELKNDIQETLEA